MIVNCILLLVGAFTAVMLYWLSLRAGYIAPPRTPRSMIRIGRSPVRKYMSEESRRIDRSPAGRTSRGSRVTTAHMTRRGR